MNISPLARLYMNMILGWNDNNTSHAHPNKRQVLFLYFRWTRAKKKERKNETKTNKWQQERNNICCDSMQYSCWWCCTKHSFSVWHSASAFFSAHPTNSVQIFVYSSARIISDENITTLFTSNNNSLVWSDLRSKTLKQTCPEFAVEYKTVNAMHDCLLLLHSCRINESIKLISIKYFEFMAHEKANTATN